MILITGGVADPNIACLVSRASRLNAKFEVAYPGVSQVDWSLKGGFLIDKKETKPKSFFQRFNTFGYDTANSSHWSWYQGWYHTFRAAALTMKWKMFDGVQGFESYCKPHDLILAEQVGLRIPDTLITDNQLLPGDNIYKPVLGGAHTQIASSKGVFGAGIGFVQKRMIGQEYRAYVVGSEVFAFRMETKSLDYREKQDVNVVPVPLSDIRVADKVRELSHRKGLYFSATDLKEDDNGQIHFLEINSAPMFSEFDKASGGNLTDAMISWLGA